MRFNGAAWLSLGQMAEPFHRDKSVISRHLKNVFEEGELDRASVVAESATTAADGKTYQVEYFNLDVVISVGYRVKSRRGQVLSMCFPRRSCFVIGTIDERHVMSSTQANDSMSVIAGDRSPLS